MGRGKWEVGLGKCEVGLVKWEVGLGKSEVELVKWKVGLVKWEVGLGKCEVENQDDEKTTMIKRNKVQVISKDSNEE